MHPASATEIAAALEQALAAVRSLSQPSLRKAA
jgi:hypothetical protein